MRASNIAGHSDKAKYARRAMRQRLWEQGRTEDTAAAPNVLVGDEGLPVALKLARCTVVDSCLRDAAELLAPSGSTVLPSRVLAFRSLPKPAYAHLVDVDGVECSCVLESLVSSLGMCIRLWTPQRTALLHSCIIVVSCAPATDNAGGLLRLAALLPTRAQCDSYGRCSFLEQHSFGSV